MKNPFRSERGTLTSGRACAVYALAFVLMLFLDATRFSSFLDRAGIDFPPAAVVGQTVKGVAEATGLAAFSEAETRLVTAFNTDKTLGTVEGPSVAAAPSTAPQRPVADALADFSREAASPAQPEPPVEEVPASVPPAAVPEQAVRTPGAQPETGIPPPPVRAETERKPLVLLVGDSMMMEGFGPVLQRTLRKRPDLEVVREGKYSTGLSRQDYFDWPAQLEKLVGKYNPDMVVICMGANDPQDIIDENRKRHHADSESWKTIYRSPRRTPACRGHGQGCQGRMGRPARHGQGTVFDPRPPLERAAKGSLRDVSCRLRGYGQGAGRRSGQLHDIQGRRQGTPHPAAV